MPDDISFRCIGIDPGTDEIGLSQMTIVKGRKPGLNSLTMKDGYNFHHYFVRWRDKHNRFIKDNCFEMSTDEIMEALGLGKGEETVDREGVWRHVERKRLGYQEEFRSLHNPTPSIIGLGNINGIPIVDYPNLPHLNCFDDNSEERWRLLNQMFRLDKEMLGDGIKVEISKRAGKTGHCGLIPESVLIYDPEALPPRQPLFGQSDNPLTALTNLLFSEATVESGGVIPEDPQFDFTNSLSDVIRAESGRNEAERYLEERKGK